MNKYKLLFTNLFKKDLKRVKKRGYNIALLDNVVNILLQGKQLPPNNKDHLLTVKWSGYRECHITPDWLLIYEIKEDKLILTLTATGTHSNLNF